MQTPVDLAHASRLVNHGPTVLITSCHGGRRNVMAAAWSMPVEFSPPRLALVIDKNTFTAELVQASGVVGIDIPCASQADLTYAAGRRRCARLRPGPLADGRQQPRSAHAAPPGGRCLRRS
jgi:flavin reductase (DIM6/NTAB) family NADH-FMN oxidoreductase RutF